MCFNVTLILYARRRAVGHLISFWKIFKADFRHLVWQLSVFARLPWMREKQNLWTLWKKEVVQNIFFFFLRMGMQSAFSQRSVQKCSSLPMHSECSSFSLCDDGHFTHWIKATSATEQKWPNALGYSGALLIRHQLRAVFCGSRAIVKTVVFTALIIRLQFSSEKGGGKKKLRNKERRRLK